MSAAPDDRTVSNKRRLKHLLINPRYQGKTILWVVLTGTVMFLLCVGVFYSFVRENYQTLVDLAPMTDEARAQLYRELHQIVVLLTVIATVFLFAMALVGLVISHRVSGPLYRMKNVMDEIRSGNTSARIKLRPGDEFTDVADCFNRMMDTLSKKLHD